MVRAWKSEILNKRPRCQQTEEKWWYVYIFRQWNEEIQHLLLSPAEQFVSVKTHIFLFFFFSVLFDNDADYYYYYYYYTLFVAELRVRARASKWRVTTIKRSAEKKSTEHNAICPRGDKRITRQRSNVK
jgi:hypothetical protein